MKFDEDFLKWLYGSEVGFIEALYNAYQLTKAFQADRVTFIVDEGLQEQFKRKTVKFDNSPIADKEIISLNQYLRRNGLRGIDK